MYHTFSNLESIFLGWRHCLDTIPNLLSALNVYRLFRCYFIIKSFIILNRVPSKLRNPILLSGDLDLMAFPTINAQQGKPVEFSLNCASFTHHAFFYFLVYSELNNRKILEELQLKKHLLTKGGLPTTGGLSGAFSNSSPTTGMPTTTQQLGNATQQLQQQQQQHQQQSQQNDITFNNTSRAAWLQATNQSSCFFLHQDSGYGNSILPVLPRFDP